METQSTVDPYNYPFLKKTETMYLSTISTCFLIQAKMTLNHLRAHMLGIPLFSVMTLMGPILGLGFLLRKETLGLDFRLLLSRYLIGQSISQKSLILFIGMILKERALKPMNSELTE